MRSAGPGVLCSILGPMRAKMMLKAIVVLGIADATLRQVKDQVRARLRELNACATRSDWSDVHAEIPTRRTQAPFLFSTVMSPLPTMSLYHLPFASYRM